MIRKSGESSLATEGPVLRRSTCQVTLWELQGRDEKEMKVSRTEARACPMYSLLHSFSSVSIISWVPTVPSSCPKRGQSYRTRHWGWGNGRLVPARWEGGQGNTTRLGGAWICWLRVRNLLGVSHGFFLLLFFLDSCSNNQFLCKLKCGFRFTWAWWVELPASIHINIGRIGLEEKGGVCFIFPCKGFGGWGETRIWRDKRCCSPYEESDISPITVNHPISSAW